MKQRYYLTYNEDNVTRPIIWELGQKFAIITNIRTGEVKEQMGLVSIELDGDAETIEAAVQWLETQGVHAEPI
ncbi:MAG: NIL domain-containing protein [Mariprofundales bacterium]